MGMKITKGGELDSNQQPCKSQLHALTIELSRVRSYLEILQKFLVPYRYYNSSSLHCQHEWDLGRYVGSRPGGPTGP